MDDCNYNEPSVLFLDLAFANFQLNECRYWHLELTQWMAGNLTLGLQCLYEAKQQTSFLKKY